MNYDFLQSEFNSIISRFAPFMTDSSQTFSHRLTMEAVNSQSVLTAAIDHLI